MNQANLVSQNITVVSQELGLPLVLGAEVTPVWSPVIVGDWIVGHCDAVKWADQEFEVLPELLFETLISMPAIVTPEQVRRLIVDHGTFRESDWVPVEVVKPKLPKQLLEEVNQRNQKIIYLLNVADVQKELAFVRKLAVVAGKMNRSVTGLFGKYDLMDLEQLWQQPKQSNSDFYPSPINANDLMRLFPRGGNFSDDYPDEFVKDESKSPQQQFREHARQIIEGAFQRAYKELPVQVVFDRMPKLATKAGSILGILYLFLLKHFDTGWRKCAREDCPNLFRSTDKRKDTCSHRCAHTKSTRERRQKEKRGKRK